MRLKKKIGSGRRESGQKTIWDPHSFPHFALEPWPFALLHSWIDRVLRFKVTGLTPFPVPWRSSITLQWPEVSKLCCLLAKLSSPLVLSFLIWEKRIILILTCSSIPRKGSPVLTPGHKNINSDIRRLSIDCCLWVFTACSLSAAERDKWVYHPISQDHSKNEAPLEGTQHC